MNKVIIMGRLGQNPERKGGIVKMSLATDRYNGPDKPKSTDWHNVVLFGKTGDLAVSSLAKGDKVLIEGSIRYTQWDKPDGTKGYGVEIVGDRMHFCANRSDSAAPTASTTTASDNDMPF
jgi:single-strand DNA-binding protein